MSIVKPVVIVGTGPVGMRVADELSRRAPQIPLVINACFIASRHSLTHLFEDWHRICIGSGGYSSAVGDV